jgi:hypothetical protein
VLALRARAGCGGAVANSTPARVSYRLALE